MLTSARGLTAFESIFLRTNPSWCYPCKE